MFVVEMRRAKSKFLTISIKFSGKNSYFVFLNTLKLLYQFSLYSDTRLSVFNLMDNVLYTFSLSLPLTLENLRRRIAKVGRPLLSYGDIQPQANTVLQINNSTV
jgi:hypothetical protein